MGTGPRLARRRTCVDMSLLALALALARARPMSAPARHIQTAAALIIGHVPSPPRCPS